MEEENIIPVTQEKEVEVGIEISNEVTDQSLLHIESCNVSAANPIGLDTSCNAALCTKCRTISNSFLSSSPFLERRPITYNSDINARIYLHSSDDELLIPNNDDDENVEEGTYMNSGTEHCHISNPDRLKSRKAITKLVIACGLTTLFMIGECIGGYLANSIAIMSDAAHLLSDLTSFIVSLVAIYLAMRPASKKMNYGYQRAEVIGAVVSVLIIWLITGVLFYMAVQRIIKQDFEVEANTMIIVSAIGVVFNIVLGFVLHSSQGSHGHSHGGISHSHNSSERNINIRAAFIHIIGDLIQSVGVLIAAYIIRYWPEYKIADPICTFLFSIIVMGTTIPILRDLSNVLMEGIPKGVDYSSIISNLDNINGVKMVHSLHVWAITMDKNALSVHLAINDDSDPELILKEAQSIVRYRHRIQHTTIQVEKYQPLLMENCQQCQPLTS